MSGHSSIPLRRWLPAFVALAFVLLSSASALWRDWREMSAAENRARARVIERMVDEQHRIEQHLRTGENGLVDEEIAQLGSIADVAAVALVDDRGRVLSSSRRVAVGRPMSEALPEFDVTRLRQAQRDRRLTMDLDAARSQLLAYQPIALEAEVGQIRPSSVGGLLMNYDLASAKATARREVVISTLVEMAFALVVMAAVMLMLRRWLSQPLEYLAEAVSRISRGDYATQVEISGSGELAELGAAVGKMEADLRAVAEERARHVAALRESEQDLASSAAMLERTGAMAKVGGWELDLRTMKLIWSLETFRIHEVDPPVAPTVDETFSFFAPEARSTIQAAVQEAIDHGTPYDVELPLITAKGRAIWVRDQCSALMEDGKAVKLMGAFHDITERRRAEASLKESEDKFRYVFDHSSVGKSITLPHGEVQVNEALSAMLGYSLNELWGMRWQELTHPEDIAATQQEMDALLNGVRDTAKYQKRFFTKEGAVVWAEISSTLRRDATGAPLYFMTSAIDITDRVRATAALRESEYFFRESQRVANIGSYRTDFVTGIWKSSEVLDLIFGIDEHYERNVPGWAEIIHPDDRAMMGQYLRDNVLGQRRAFDNEYRIVRKSDGAMRWVHGFGALEIARDGRVVGMTGTIQDITERKRAEDALRDSERRLRDITSSMGDWVWELDEKAVYTYASAKGIEMLGDVIGKTPFEFMRPEEAARVSLLFADIVAAKAPIRDLEHWNVTRNGDAVCLLTNGVPILDADGRLKGYRGVDKDITERMRSLAVLRLESAALAAAANAIVITDRDGVIEWANAAFTTFTGYRVEEAVGCTPGQLLKSGSQDEAFYRTMWHTIQSGDVWHGEVINKRKDGSEYTEDMTITPLRNERGEITHFIAVKQDVSQRKVLEEQFRQSQKMESVGRLAGGVAHDFNNMLTVILGRTELGLLQTDTTQPIHAHLLEIEEAAKRSANLTRQLLAFARLQTITPRVLDLNETVADSLRMLQRLIGENIQLTWRPAAGLWPIRIDPSQMDQILANMCINVRDAIQDVGALTIATANRRLDAAFCAAHADAEPGEYVQLTISDTGCGMDPSTLAQIFDPFFTTKEVGKGTGLGLSTVYGAIKQNGGCITVASEPGRGTTFDIYLPRCLDKDPAEQASAAKAPTPRGQETILLVEDEPVVLALTAEMLETQGYTVLVAAGPGAAIHAAEEHAGRIDLLLTDVIMPEMNGRELANKLAARQPRLRCLFMSGYTSDIIGARGVLDHETQFLQKPFSLAALAAAVREALDGKQA
ncbi:MAG TPA: PAS domain S-box protein [Gemmatimonadaceae bacterium]